MIKKLFIVLIWVSTAYSAQLGVNISLPERGGTFVDIVKEGYRWSDVKTGQDMDSNQVDSSGWPLCDARYVVDYRPVAEWQSAIDDPEQYRIDASGAYTCSFIGQATLSTSGGSVQNKLYNPATNITTFDFVVTGPPGANHGLFIIDFSGTKRAASGSVNTGFTNFKMIRPGYPANTKQTFTNDFINALNSASFSAIRFMGFTSTNDAEPDYPAVTGWDHRKLPTDASQNRITPLGKKDGAAWEYVIELANLVKKDIWINIPVSATANYVTRLASMIKDSLNSALHVYVESSNEVWNTAPGFNQSSYNKAQAQALGIGEHQNHARRTIELANIFSTVFGAGSLNNRVRVILCSHQPMLKWWVEPMLQYINNTSGAPKNFIYAIACQMYFSGGADAGESVTKILDDCHNSITSQIDETGKTNEAGRMQWIRKASAWGFTGGFCSYEGGPDHGGGSTVNIANRITAERSQRMAAEINYSFDDAFFKLGGNMVMYFTLSSGYNRYGCWGLTDDISKPERNYKFQAVRDLIGTSTSVNDSQQKTLPDEYELFQNYPNPFNPETVIRFQTPQAEIISLKIYNVLGQEVKAVINEQLSAGTHEVRWDGTDNFGNKVSSGIYIYLMSAGDFVKVKKMALLR